MSDTSHDLGNGWFVTMERGEHGNGSTEAPTYTFRNCDKGQRISLDAESSATLRRVLAGEA